MYGGEFHYRLKFEVGADSVTVNDTVTPRQEYLTVNEKEWPGNLFGPILQWPELTPLWESIEVREVNRKQALRKRDYTGKLREDLHNAARSAFELAFNPKEAQARGIKLLN